MAGRNFSGNRIYSFHMFPVQLEARVSIGSTGAPTLITSSTIPGTSNPSQSIGQSKGITSITRLSAGRYRIQLQDNYSSLFDFKCTFESPVSGSNIPVDATTAGLSVGTVYQITAVGTATTAADWVALGLPAGMTAAVGQTFKAATTGTGIQSGAGTVKVIGTNAAAYQAEIIGDPDAMLNNQPSSSGGGYVCFQTIGPTTPGTSSADATPVAKDPSSGSVMIIKLLLSNSSIQ